MLYLLYHIILWTLIYYCTSIEESPLFKCQFNLWKTGSANFGVCLELLKIYRSLFFNARIIIFSFSLHTRHAFQLYMVWDHPIIIYIFCGLTENLCLATHIWRAEDYTPLVCSSLIKRLWSLLFFDCFIARFWSPVVCKYPIATVTVYITKVFMISNSIICSALILYRSLCFTNVPNFIPNVL